MFLLSVQTALSASQALCKRMLADGYQVRGTVRGTTQMMVLPSGVEGALVGKRRQENRRSEVGIRKSRDELSMLDEEQGWGPSQVWRLSQFA